MPSNFDSRRDHALPPYVAYPPQQPPAGWHAPPAVAPAGQPLGHVPPPRGGAAEAYYYPQQPQPAHVRPHQPGPAQPPLHTPGAAVPTYGAAMVHTYGAHHLTHQLEQVRGEINAHLKKHPIQAHAGRAVTIVGSLGAIGAGVATGVAVFTGVFGSLSGIGMPVAAAAALGGIGVALAGIGIAAFAGAATRAVARSAVKKDPALAKKVAALQVMQSELLAKKNLTSDDKILLRNVNTVLGKVGGFKAHLKSQTKLAGKTTGVAALSVFVVALVACCSMGNGDSGGGLFWFGGSPLPLPTPTPGSHGLQTLPGGSTGDDDVSRWSQSLHELGVHA